MTRDRDLGQGESVAPERDADRRFVDAMLHHHFHGSEAAAAERIAAALQKIDDAPVSVGRSVTGVWWFRAACRGAAALLVAALLLIPALLSNPAAAALDRARVAMSRWVDLHYRIEIETPVGVTVPGEIWFRGADFVALRVDTVAGVLWAGEGRDAAWVVPPLSGMPVRVNDKGRLLEVLRIEDDVSAPLLRISTMLERFGDGFEFELDRDGETIEARRVAGAPENLPEHVEVRIAADGVVRELEAQWPGILGPRGCRLTWLDDDEVSASFYEHASHHDRSRPVIDLR